jgi:cytoskeleton protein RodZ
MFDRSSEPPVAGAPEQTQVAEPTDGANPAPLAGPPPPMTGAVVLTAKEPVWLRIYEAGGKRLFEKEMAANESYTVPADAASPEILTGRPDALKVTVGGKEVAPLGPPQKTVKDLPISAAALSARPPASLAPAPLTPAPVNSATTQATPAQN